jgi:hypothetical protein
MAVLLEKSLSYIFNSDPASGAQNVSADGSVFQVSLNTPISIPKSAIDCSAGVIQAAIWSTSPNIAADFKNNQFEFTTTAAPAGTYTLTIPDGLYSVAGLNSYFSSQFTNLGLPSNLITLSGDSATQKSILTFSVSGDSIDFTIANSVREVLGFNAAVITAPSAGYSFFSDNTAAFNRVNSYIIASNLVSQGIPVNSQSRGIIGTVPISVAPGSQINYSPQNVVWFDCGELIGSPKINMTFSLLDQDLRPTPTAGDSYSFVILIKYHILLAQGTLPLKPA